MRLTIGLVVALFVFVLRVGGQEPVLNSCALPGVAEYTLNCFAEEQKKRDLILVEKIFDIDGCGKISRLGFLFDYYDPVSTSQARMMVTRLVTDFLDQVNKSDKLKPFLAISPFAVNDVSIRIRLRRKDCGYIYPKLGNIAYVSAVDGMIIYDTINSFTYDLDTLRQETFEEAVRYLPTK